MASEPTPGAPSLLDQYRRWREVQLAKGTELAAPALPAFPADRRSAAQDAPVSPERLGAAVEAEREARALRKSRKAVGRAVLGGASRSAALAYGYTKYRDKGGHLARPAWLQQVAG